MKNVDVLYEDEDCLVLNKPSGLATQGGAHIGVSLDSLLRREWNPAPLLVHRLDKDTSGIILVAKNKAVAGRYSFFRRWRDFRVPGYPRRQQGILDTICRAEEL